MNSANKSRSASGRRRFLKGAAATLAGAALRDNIAARGEQMASPQAPEDAPVAFRPQTSIELRPVEAPLAANLTRTWLGPHYWANRLQDWRWHQGRIECLANSPDDQVRTVAMLTREIVAGEEAAYLSVRAGLLEEGIGGFCGFLIGVGAGQLDYRAAALAQKASGVNGGLLCAYESDGRVRFREHTDEERPLVFAESPADESALGGGGAAAKLTTDKSVRLRLEITPQAAGRFELKFFVTDEAGGRFLGGAIRRNVADSELTGGIALVSSPNSGAAPGARFWFNDMRAGGAKIAVRDERALGPIIGALYSLNGSTLKLSAQLMPVGDGESRAVKFQYRSALAERAEAAEARRWRDGPTAELKAGYTALFRITDWDASRDWEYRIVYETAGAQPAYYAGLIRRDPGRATKEFKIGLFSCAAATARSLEGGGGRPQPPSAETLGRYTRKNFYFPHDELARNASRHNFDLLVFAGDQFYENNPTRVDRAPAPLLDYLYKWYMWVWSFRELTRNTPSIALIDDHDVYHGNLWGNGGRPAPERDQNRGGYRNAGDWVNMVQRTQCGHNPDPYDPTPVEQGIGVYYASFTYGPVSFAILEDRKFKTSPLQGANLDVHEAELLGERQERFLAAWAKDREPNLSKICLTQTLFGCLQTSPAGKPLLDFDSNGYPKPGRDRAIRLLRQAGALALAGDQHLASVVRHGIDTFEDGVAQFTGPACGASWQRWFEPAQALPNAIKDRPHTGDFVDAFGNKMRVLAVANPRVTFAEYRKHNRGNNQSLGDRRLKSEGYGVIRVRPSEQEYVIECWGWDVDPSLPGARQFAGWPIRLRFDEVAGS